MIDMRGSSEESESDQGGNNSQHAREVDEKEVQQKIEKRADLIAVTLQTVISLREPENRVPDQHLNVGTQKRGLYKNDPFRKNLSHSNLLQVDEDGRQGRASDSFVSANSLNPKMLAGLQEIRQRLMERGASQSSQSGSGAATGTLKLAKPVIHESLYVYAADKVKGGMALAEKWRLTLVQPRGSSHKKSSIRRKSILTGVDTTGLNNETESPFPVK